MCTPSSTGGWALFVLFAGMQVNRWVAAVLAACHFSCTERHPEHEISSLYESASRCGAAGMHQGGTERARTRTERGRLVLKER